MTKRKMVRIDEDLGQLIRVGNGLDFNSCIDVGSLIYMNHDKGELCIRSFMCGKICTYEMGWTNSSVIENPKVYIYANKGVAIDFKFKEKKNG